MAEPSLKAAAWPPTAVPRWWTLATRAFLVLAFAGWVSIVAGYAQHQERLNNTARGAVSLDHPEQLLDRISSWALLHSAEYFAKYRAALDPGAGFQKFYWLNALEAAGLVIGAVATLPDDQRGLRFPTARILASGILAMGQAPDLPESAIELLANYKNLAVPLPSYRIAQVVGASIVPFASLAAAMVLGWNPVSPGPDVTAVDPPPPEARGLNRLQAAMERVYLGTIDRIRRPALIACIVAMWICTAVGWAGYGAGVASGKWWHTHIPLCAIALATQVLANSACVFALLPAVEGRGAGTALAATGAALALNIWRINRSWQGGLTLVAVRLGIQPPPHFVLYNAATILWLLMAAGVMTFMGFRRPQAEDGALVALPYRVIIFTVAGPVALAGVILCTAATLVSTSQEQERRMWFGETYFSQSGDRWWLMYTLVVYYTIAPKPFHTFCPMVLARSRETMVYGSLIVALGTNYMVNKSTNGAVNAGLWMILAGFLIEAVMSVLATDSPAGVHTWPRRAARALAAPCTSRRLGPGPKPLLVARAADPEAGGPHTVRLLVPKLGADAGRPPAPAPGDVVLHQLIGTGSFASVFKASYAGAPVAVKVLSSASPAAQAAARKEAQLALSLRHPCVLQTFAVLDVQVPASALADATSSAVASTSASPGATQAALEATSAALAEFAAVLQAAPDGGPDLLEGGGGRGGGDDPARSPPPSGSDAVASATAADTPPTPTVSQVWIVQQFMDRGTLEHAIRKGVFRRRGVRRGSPGDRGGGGSGGSGGGSGSAPSAGTDRPYAAQAGLSPSPTGNVLALAPPSAKQRRPSAATNPVAALLATLHDIASGLAYLHKVGIVHGDLKSANILLTSRSAGGIPGGRPPFGAVIADFGLSRALAPPPGEALPTAGPGPDTHIFTHTFGTAAYTAPEIVREGRLSSRSDVYALGLLMWEMWTGVVPFAGMPAAAVFFAVGMVGRRPSLDEFGDAPPGYTDLMVRLWSDAAGERPTAADAAQRLKALLDAELGGGGGCGEPGPPPGGGEAGAPARPPSTPRPPATAAEE